MNTRIVYVLVSNKSDFYSELLLLSLYSLHIYHPDVIADVILDEDTHRRLARENSPILKKAHPVIVPIPNKYSTTLRSRYLKTKLREIISGDFLFLDTDTIVAGSLESIDNIISDIAAVWDNHDGEFFKDQFEPHEWSHLFPVKRFNSGVLYVKDTNATHLFYQQWHENWKYCVSRGCHFDQPGFRKAYAESGIEIESLSGIWNCQVTRATSTPFIDDAKVLHYQRAGAVISLFGHSIRKKGLVCGDAASFAKDARYFLSGHNLYLTTLEYEELDPFRFTLINYPRYFRFLSALSKSHARLIEFLAKAKAQIRK